MAYKSVQRAGKGETFIAREGIASIILKQQQLFSEGESNLMKPKSKYALRNSNYFVKATQRSLRAQGPRSWPVVRIAPACTDVTVEANMSFTK